MACSTRASAMDEGTRDAAGQPSYWGGAARRLRERALPRLALLVLLALASAAVWAPFLASDRPYLLEAVHQAEYERALRTLVPVARALEALAGPTPGETGPALATGLAAERSALDLRLATLERHLAPAHGAAAGALRDKAKELLARAARDPARAPSAAGELVRAAEELRAALDPARVELRPVRSLPLLAALSPAEVFFLALWLGTAGLWLGRRLGKARPSPRRALASVVALALASAVLWKLAVGGGAPFHGASFKRELASGELRAARILFPPFAFGYAEPHPEEALRPPTWLASAEIDERGDYVRGARAPRTDPVTGFRPPSVPVEVRPGEPGRNSPWRHPLGTDSLGRDLLARAIHGTRTSLGVALAATALLVLLGVLVGALAGFAGGWIDLLLSRLIEVVLAFPVLFLILVAVALLGPSPAHVVLVIGCVGWTGIARLARAEVLRLRGLDFVLAARALGYSRARVVLRHVLPNALPPLLVGATFALSAALLVESALSFLGFGARLPVPSWGGLANESREIGHWWIQLFPGALVFATVLCVNLIGDAVRDALDPRLSSGGRSG
jgi:peptide/nickel transport system permease protein